MGYCKRYIQKLPAVILEQANTLRLLSTLISKGDRSDSIQPTAADEKDVEMLRIYFTDCHYLLIEIIIN
jgi:hypothetical protein